MPLKPTNFRRAPGPALRAASGGRIREVDIQERMLSDPRIPGRGPGRAESGPPDDPNEARAGGADSPGDAKGSLYDGFL